MSKRILLLVLILAGTSQAQWGSVGSRFYWYRNGGTPTTDSLRFVQGTGATLTQSGKTLTIAATGTGTTVAQARKNTGWTTQTTPIATDTSVARYRIDAINSEFVMADVDTDTLRFRPQPTANANILEYKDATTTLASIDSLGNATFTNYPVGGSGWNDTGTEIEQITTTDEVVIGGTAAINSAKVTIDGDADQVQLMVQGHSTQSQTNPLLLVEDSAGDDLLRLQQQTTAGTYLFVAPHSVGNQQSGIYFPAYGITGGWVVGRDQNNNGTNDFEIRGVASSDAERFVIGTTGLISINPVTLTNGWASLGINASAATSTLSLTNSTLGLDATSGLLISMPTGGAGTFKSFDGDFEFNSADAAKEYIFDIADDNDNDFIFDDAGVMVFSSGQTNSFQIAPAATDVAAFTAAVGGYTFDSEASVKQHNIQDTTGVVLSAPGAGTISVSNLKLDTFASAALDTAVTLTGTIGDIVYISTRAATRDIAFLDAGNFQLGAERVLDDPQDVLVLMAITTTVWKEIYFANNN